VTNVAIIDTLRSLNFSGISGTYAQVGTPLTHITRIICLTNNTNGDLFVSNDGVTDNLFMPANSFKLFDLATNRSDYNSTWSFSDGMPFFVKQSTAPTSGDFYIECVYASGE
jgi:hypothetical protein